MSTEPLAPTQLTRSQILEDAWFRFAQYDRNAVITQNRFVRQRKWILILGVAATTLAVIYSTIERYLANNPVAFPNWLTPQQFLDGFHFIVIAVPIIVTVLVAFSEKFNMGISWIMLRSSAEAIKKEIYRYRTQVDEYNPKEITAQETRDIRLAKRLKIISRRLMETAVNQTDLLSYQGELPPRLSTPEGDDGFSDMTAENYLIWRVEDQFSYYQKKAARLGKALRQFQLFIIFLGGVGALLAAIKLDIWLAVSNALAVAFASYLEFKRVESNVVSCNLAAADLYDIRIWWRSLSPEARTQRANLETLVSGTEAVLQTENAGWLQEMREALAEIYKEKKDAPVGLLPEEAITPGMATSEKTSASEFHPKFTRDTTVPESAPEPSVLAEPSQTVVSTAETQPEMNPSTDGASATIEEMPEPGIFVEPSQDVASDH